MNISGALNQIVICTGILISRFIIVFGCWLTIARMFVSVWVHFHQRRNRKCDNSTNVILLRPAVIIEYFSTGLSCFCACNRFSRLFIPHPVSQSLIHILRHVNRQKAGKYANETRSPMFFLFVFTLRFNDFVGFSA